VTLVYSGKIIRLLFTLPKTFMLSLIGGKEKAIVWGVKKEGT
jgi:hypothetical protein